MSTSAPEAAYFAAVPRNLIDDPEEYEELASGQYDAMKADLFSIGARRPGATTTACHCWNRVLAPRISREVAHAVDGAIACRAGVMLYNMLTAPLALFDDPSAGANIYYEWLGNVVNVKPAIERDDHSHIRDDRILKVLAWYKSARGGGAQPKVMAKLKTALGAADDGAGGLVLGAEWTIHAAACFDFITSLMHPIASERMPVGYARDMCRDMCRDAHEICAPRCARDVRRDFPCRRRVLCAPSITLF